MKISSVQKDPNSQTFQTVYYISDRTGRTSETNAESLLTQFPNLNYETYRFPFIDSISKAENIAHIIKERTEKDKNSPLVFSSIIDHEVRQTIKDSGAVVFDIYETFLPKMEKALNEDSETIVGASHEDFEEQDSSEYQKRSKALDFSLSHDDGLKIGHYDKAEIIVVGVSRSAKTPVCLYLAMNFSILAANYPLAGEDLEGETLPVHLRDKKDKIVALHISPERLHEIRQKRRPDSHYSSLMNCRQEVRRAEEIYKIAGIPVYDTSATSIEEIAVQIMRDKKLFR